MYDYIIAALFGIVQGITEFLPISSSGHLVLLHHFFKIPIENEMAFDVALHFSTLLAVVYFFRKDIRELFADFCASVAQKNLARAKTAYSIIIATIPAGLAGLFLEDYIESKFRSLLVVAVMLIAVGVLFIVMEKRSKQTEEISALSYANVFMVGLSQALALIPGTSRSGITIITGLGLGLKRKEAIRLSFLLSIPIIFGAFVSKIPDLINVSVSGKDFWLLSTSFVSSYVAGFLAIKYFLKFAEKYSLNIFAYYRFALSILVLAYFFVV